MAGILKYWREAATLIIITPRLQTPKVFPQQIMGGIGIRKEAISQPKLKQTQISPDINEHGNKIKKDTGQYISDYEALLLKRSSKSKFMPNRYVFPGGIAENDDFSPEWISLFGKLGKDFQKSVFQKVSRGSTKAAPMFTRTRDPQFSEIPPEVAFRITAIRETFEESGILIAKKVEELQEHKYSLLSERWNLASSMSSVNNNFKLQEWRELVNKSPENFLKMCKEMDLIPDILSLYEWTNWLTPTAAGGRRYDTIFYICCLEHKPETKEDTLETIHYQWISPSSVLSAYYKDNVKLAPPQIYELSRVLQFDEAEHLMKFSADRESERVERWFPVIAAMGNTLVSLMPGDDLYPENPDLYTPKKIIHFDKTMEELDKDAKNFHRSITYSHVKNSEQVKFNIVFKNKHIGPVINVGKLLGKL